MKVVYLLRHGGLSSRTPQGWESVVITPRPDGGYSRDELEQMADADFLVAGAECVHNVLLTRTRKLKLVQRLGVGHDGVDLEMAKRLNIRVCNMPDFNAGTVAEHALMLMLALLRRLFESTLLMKSGKWPVSTVVGSGLFDLQGKTLGIVGCGNIGREVARRARPFGVSLVYFDRKEVEPGLVRELGVSRRALDSVLSESDIVTIHLPLAEKTRGLIGKRELELMKSTALLINTARGAIVDEAALAESLQKRRIAGAGIDVFSDEPLDEKHPLRRCPNVLLTPHTAGQTREAMERMVTLMRENLERVARGEEPLYSVDGY